MRSVEVKINIKTSPKRVISAFTDENILCEWWKVERMLIEKKKGGVYTLAWNISGKGFGFISTGKIRDYKPNSLLIVDNLINLNPEKQFFGPMSLVIKTRTKKNGITELHLCQDGYQEGNDWDWYYEAVKQAWPKVLLDLKEYLEK